MCCSDDNRIVTACDFTPLQGENKVFFLTVGKFNMSLRKKKTKYSMKYDDFTST
jgi:hypothetical protein